MDEQEVDPKEGTKIGEMTEPIIIDLGKQKKKRLKKLKKGRGRLWYEVLDVLDEVDVQLGEQVGERVLVPVILIYERKRSRKSRMFPF